MAYGAFQTSVARMDEMAVGAVLEPQSAFIDDKKAVQTSTGIGVGVIVSRGTDPQRQVVVGVSTSPLGISCRAGNVAGALGSEATNTPVYAQYEICPVLRSGQMPVYLASGSASAGSTTFSVTDSSGVLKLGAATAAGQSNVTGLTLETTMTAAGIALVTIDADSFACTAYTP